MTTDPSGKVKIVRAVPAVTVSPASTGHVGTPVPGVIPAPRNVNEADEVTVATCALRLRNNSHQNHAGYENNLVHLRYLW